MVVLDKIQVEMHSEKLTDFFSPFGKQSEGEGVGDWGWRTVPPPSRDLKHSFSRPTPPIFGAG